MIEEDIIQINETIYIIYKESTRYDYTYWIENSAGQRVKCLISIFYKDDLNKKKYWSIGLSVNKKSKGYEFGKITGKTGIESLLLGKEILKYHIENIIKEDNDWNHIIIVWWDDIRRKYVYERGLKDIGFKYGQFAWKEGYNTGKCLYKIYNKE